MNNRSIDTNFILIKIKHQFKCFFFCKESSQKPKSKQKNKTKPTTTNKHNNKPIQVDPLSLDMVVSNKSKHIRMFSQRRRANRLQQTHAQPTHLSTKKTNQNKPQKNRALSFSTAINETKTQKETNKERKKKERK